MAGWLAGWLVLAALRCGGNGCVAGRSSCWEAPLVLVLELELEPRLVLELEQGWSGLRSPSSGGSGVCWGRTCTGVTVGSGFWVGGSGRDGRFGFGCCGSPSILLLFGRGRGGCNPAHHSVSHGRVRRCKHDPLPGHGTSSTAAHARRPPRFCCG